MMLAADASLEDLDQGTARGRRRILTVRTKVDQAEPRGLVARFGNEWTDFKFDFQISSRTGEGLDALMNKIAELAAEAAGLDGAGSLGEAIPLRTRQKELVADALRILEEFVENADQPAEIGAETLRRASNRLGAITGQVGVEDLLDVIFSEFCIGK